MPSNSWNNGSALQQSRPQDKNGLMWQYQVHPVAFWEDVKGTGEIATRDNLRITWKRKVGSQYFNFSSKHYKVSNAAIIPQEVQKSLNRADLYFIFPRKSLHVYSFCHILNFRKIFKSTVSTSQPYFGYKFHYFITQNNYFHKNRLTKFLTVWNFHIFKSYPPQPIILEGTYFL